MPRLTPQKKLQVIALKATGTPVTEIARQMDCSRRAIHKMLRKTLGAALPLQDIAATKEKLRRSSFGAVESGLDCPVDSYKRGVVAMNVLKHTGDLRPDPSQVLLINADWPDDGELELVLSDPAIPPEERERLLADLAEIDREKALGDHD